MDDEKKFFNDYIKNNPKSEEIISEVIKEVSDSGFNSANFDLWINKKLLEMEKDLIEKFK